MIGTESKLWQHLRTEIAEQVPRAAFDRIESPITPGASDVHYVMKPWSGWIELKTAAWPRRINRGITLHSPFSLSQLGWLLMHHDRAHHLRSWLLIGIIGPRTWRNFLLCEPTPSTRLLAIRKATALELFLTLPGVYNIPDIKNVVARIRCNHENHHISAATSC
jgi:hypothetical protein